MEKKAAKRVYAGLFLVTLSTMMLEIVLTRIFSVTMWYHFAFLAVSIAMFGMTLGSLLVYLLPGYFSDTKTDHHLALSAFLFGLASILSIIVHIALPYNNAAPVVKLLSVTLTFMTVSLPFICSGVCVSLVLSRYSSAINKVYAADLAGAAAGCIAIKYLLDVTDGPTAVIAVALLASLASVAFALSASGTRMLYAFGLTAAALAIMFCAGSYSVANQTPLLQLKWAKGALEAAPLYEKWNSFSRIKVTGNPDQPGAPIEWHGLSERYAQHEKVRQVHLTIDGDAATVLTRFDGDLRQLKHLDYDVTNLVHYLRPDSKVFIIGAGGGRDILSSLRFRQKSVLAVEINENILQTVNGVYGGFTGHLDRYPKITFVNDEGRSYLLRSKQSFDIIQASLIDTWAATAAGAFTMTENSLYTLEAWKAFLDHLTPRGVLTFTRWYMTENPKEIYRLTALACASLRGLDVPEPKNNILVVKNIPPGMGYGLATILVGKTPFSEGDLRLIEELAAKMKFDIVLGPRHAIDRNFAEIASNADLEAVAVKVGSNLTPPTYDTPFFFHTLRLKDFRHAHFFSDVSSNGSMFTLWGLLIIIPVMSYTTILQPLRTATALPSPKGITPYMAYFTAIGLGFVLVELSQIQKLAIFLGHPSYSLSVVLFSLLLSSGIGSFTVRPSRDFMRSGCCRLSLFLVLLVITGFATPYVLGAFEAATIHVRVAVSVALIFPVGLFMGMAYPLGIRALTQETVRMIPWLWGVNGAASVFASVLAVAFSMESGITATYCLGCLCYLAAFAAFAWKLGPAAPPPAPQAPAS